LRKEDTDWVKVMYGIWGGGLQTKR